MWSFAALAIASPAAAVEGNRRPPEAVAVRRIVDGGYVRMLVRHEHERLRGVDVAPRRLDVVPRLLRPPSELGVRSPDRLDDRVAGLEILQPERSLGELQDPCSLQDD